MEQLNFITNILGINDKNIFILDYLDAGTHKEVIAKLDYPASKCLNCQGQMAKYDFQKESKIPYLECAGYKTLIRLRKRRFRCKDCGKELGINLISITDKITQNTFKIININSVSHGSFYTSDTEVEILF